MGISLAEAKNIASRRLVKPPKSESLLQNALNVSREVGKTGFQIGQGFLSNLPQNIAENPMSFAMGGVPGVQLKAGTQPYQFFDESMAPETTEFSEKFLNPQSDIGQITGGVGNFLTGLVNPIKAIGATPNLIREAAVMNAQRKFFPWQKAARTEYGQKLGEGIRALIRTGKGNVSPQETEALFSGIMNPAQDVAQQLPTKVRQVGERVSRVDPQTGLVTGKGMSIKQLRTEQARLGRSLTSAERSGKLVTERSRLVTTAIKRIKAYMKSKIPNLPNEEYSRFMTRKGVVEKAIDPASAKLGTLGTAGGTSALKGISGMEPAEIQALSEFSESAKAPLIGPAKFANLLDSIGKGLKQSAGIAAIGAPPTIGIGYLLNRMMRSAPFYPGGGNQGMNPS